ncbi:MAG: hypothetical protein ACI865_000070 [Flavobacteriaceae bacterium]|jgi:hypothetical protein
MNSLFILLGLLLISSCASTDEGQKVADQLFKLIVEEKFDAAAELIELNPGITVDERIAIAESLGAHQTFGKLVKVKKTIGFNTSIDNGLTTVALPYKLKFEKGDYATTVTIIDRGNGFKLSSLE